MNNKAVIYIRVSTDEQTEQSQLEPCKKFCLEHGYEVVDVCRDHAKSAYKNVKRKGYDQVMHLVKKREIGHVVVWALDRWLRKGPKELRNSVDYLNMYDVQLHSVSEYWIESINLPGSMGNLIKDFFFGLMGWLAERESKRLSERVLTSEKFIKAKKKGKVGRATIADEVKNRVIEYLREEKSYRWISQNVTYKVKYGKVRHVSVATISDIKKSALEKGYL